MPVIRHLRGTKASFDALVTANQLLTGSFYILTDVKRVAAALSGNTFTILPQYANDVDLPFPIRIATPKIAGAANGTALTTLALTAARQYFIPFVSPVNLPITALRISVTTLLAGTAAIGVYSNTVISSNDSPQNLLASVTGLDTSTVGDKSGSVAFTFEAGKLYWISVIANSAVTLRALAVGGIQSCLGFTVNGTTAISHLFVTGSGSTLPNIASTTPSAGTGSIPAIYLVGS